MTAGRFPDTRLTDLLGIELPIIQAPMAGVMSWEMVVGVCAAGGLGSFPCAMLDVAGVRAGVAAIREKTTAPFNMNFFCHESPAPSPERDEAWRARLAPYLAELGADPASTRPVAREPFALTQAALVEELRPAVVSFHFGLPPETLLDRVKATGAKVLSSATTVEEARYLEAHGADIVVAQGAEAGGHRGLFLTDRVASQVGLFALLPQMVDAVKIPVVASGGVADGRGVAAAFALGAAGVQIGTAYLFCEEARVTSPHRAALARARDDDTVLTNVFTGRPARSIVNRLVREVGPLSPLAPAFPGAATALVPLRAQSEKDGSGDFMPLWAGQAASLGRRMVADAPTAAALTTKLAREARALLR